MARRLLTLLMASLASTIAAGAGETGMEASKTLSPYFVVSGGEGGEAFPLKSTLTRVGIAGVIAEVTVTQVYANTGRHPIEAVYVFPGSTRAAVHGLRMTIGERVIEAKIAERQEAQRTYEKAKDEGKAASLLQQQRPNVFQMNVANVMPGDRVEVELRYTELLVPEAGAYEFVYPTVVGPRYSNRPETNAEPEHAWTQNPYLREGETPPSTFELQASVVGGLPIAEIVSPSHRILPRFEAADRAVVRLDPAETAGANRDFILRYRLGDRRIETGLLVQKGHDESFFLLMVQPPRSAPARVVPREYIFVVDVSGSMHGFPLDTARTLMKRLVGGLGPNDRFDLLLFAGGSEILAPTSLPATPENLTRAVRVLESASAGGGTELLPALERALALPATEGMSRSIVLVTDGYVDVEREAFDLVRGSLRRANLFTFGIGSSVNRHLIEGLARVGRGEPFVVTGPSLAQSAAERFLAYVSTPLLTGAELRFEGFAAEQVEPPVLPDLFAERPIVVFGKWKGPLAGRIVLRGATGGATWQESLDVARQARWVEGRALASLWARERVALLSDLGSLPSSRRAAGEEPVDVRRAVLELGLQYDLLTRYTSFVAVDSEVRRKQGGLRTLKQPLPLPQGVPEQAVGGVPTTPEPETWMLLAAVAAVLSVLALRRSFA